VTRLHTTGHRCTVWDMDINDDWVTPQQAATMLGVSLKTAYAYASQFGWTTKSLGAGPHQGVLYWADEVREELPNHGRTPSRWDA